MASRNGSMRMALWALLIGMISGAASTPHDRAAASRSQQTDEKRPSTEREIERLDADQRGTPALPLVVQSLSPPKTQEEIGDEARERDAKRFNDKATLLIAVGTLLFVAIQTVVFWLQAQRLKQTIDAMKQVGTRQSDDMQSSIVFAEKAAIAARVSAQVARKAVEASEKTAQRQLRAYIGVTELTVFFGSPIDRIKVDFVIQNFGQTPANSVHLEYRVIGNENSEVLDETAGKEPYLTKPAVTIMPGGRYSGDIKSEILDASNIFLRQTDRLAVWVVGRVTYVDAFGTGQTTNFRRVAAPNQTDFVPHIDGNNAT